MDNNSGTGNKIISAYFQTNPTGYEENLPVYMTILARKKVV